MSDRKLQSGDLPGEHPQVVRKQVFTEDMACRIALMLGIERPAGEAIPLGWHFPLLGADNPARLRIDGFRGLGFSLPDLPGRRLIAAGRSVTFGQIIGVGQDIERVSRITSIVPKSNIQGAMTVVTVRHRLSEHGTGALVVDEAQTYILLDASYVAPEHPIERPSEPVVRIITPDETQLFQFSALSFNAHKIHLDRDYARSIEGYPDLVVNGGLTTLFMTELARAEGGAPIRRLTVRNTAPLFVNRPIQFATAQRGAKQEILAFDETGRLAAEMEYDRDDL